MVGLAAARDPAPGREKHVSATMCRPVSHDQRTVAIDVVEPLTWLIVSADRGMQGRRRF